MEQDRQVVQVSIGEEFTGNVVLYGGIHIKDPVVDLLERVARLENQMKKIQMMHLPQVDYYGTRLYECPFCESEPSAVESFVQHTPECILYQGETA